MSTLRGRLLAAVMALGAVVALVVGITTATQSGAQRSDASSGVRVTVAQGKLRGAEATNYDAWLGVPFAAPPVGNRRWQPPKPAARWTGTRDATTFGDRCVQGTGWDPGYEANKLSEDCLYLNVYAPQGNRADLPVLVWIHGGGFTGGAGQDTDPRRYVQRNDAIVVTINYRLGVLGFLNTAKLAARYPNGAGNVGLLDQQAALRWVHRNVDAFGGDAGNVTIAGQSAGGSSVCDQLASPTAKGLFQKAVVMSGGCSMTSAAEAQESGADVVAALGCADTRAELACLRRVPPAEIVAAQKAGASARPSVGGVAFPLDPEQAVMQGKFTRVPVINGQVHDERRLNTFQNYDYVGNPITAPMYRQLVRTTYGAHAAEVLARYPVADYSTPGIAWATVQSDEASALRKRVNDQMAKYTKVFAYEFDVPDTPQFASIYRLQQTNAAAAKFEFGATHVDDLPYLWEYLGQTLPLTDDQLALSDQTTSYWSMFQRSGNPNGGTNPPWPAYRAANPTWFEQRACDTDPADSALPGACSVASSGYLTDHQVAFWNEVSA